MKRKLIVVALMSIFAPLMAAYAADASLATQTDKLSYTIGADMGSNFKGQSITVEPKILMQGMQDALSGASMKMTKEEMQQTLKDFQTQMIAKKMTEFKTIGAKNKADGDKFLADNKVKSGVVTLPSGLQYKIVEAGTGAKPEKADSVTVDYTGTLINGTVFDSSQRNGGKPVTFKLDQVIPGWTEALQLMKQGATWEIYVPANLAYGERGIGGPIGPNQTLVFKIHLISITKPAAPANVTASTTKK